MEFSLFDDKFLQSLVQMKHKNIAVEMLKKLIIDQICIYKRKSVVKNELFSERMQSLINSYINGLISNEEVIDELLKMARDIKNSSENDLGLSEEVVAFYDALTKPQAVKDAYENEELVKLTHELTEALRANRTVDWTRKESARAKMRVMVKRLLKKYKYPPEGQEEALKTVMAQCELWTDNPVID